MNELYDFPFLEQMSTTIFLENANNNKILKSTK